MKTLLITVALISITALTSCQKDREENNPVRDQLLGKWRLERIETDVYSPVNVFSYHDMQMGIATDSIVFKANGEVYNYIDDPLDPDITEWVVVNDSTISIDEDILKIRELTPTRLCLRADDTFASQNKREVSDAYFYR
jgi:hypothetical protein